MTKLQIFLKIREKIVICKFIVSTKLQNMDLENWDWSWPERSGCGLPGSGCGLPGRERSLMLLKAVLRSQMVPQQLVTSRVAVPLFSI